MRAKIYVSTNTNIFKLENNNVYEYKYVVDIFS